MARGYWSPETGAFLGLLHPWLHFHPELTEADRKYLKENMYLLDQAGLEHISILLLSFLEEGNHQNRELIVEWLQRLRRCNYMPGIKSS